MASINKTPNYGLNQWQGNEYPKRQDFVDDNLNADTAIKSVDNSLAAYKAESANKHITESGSNANGSYIKFDDGTMICTIVKTDNLAISSAYLGGFVSVLQSWTMPATFKDAPKVVSGVNNAIGIISVSTSTIVTYGYTSIATQVASSRMAKLCAIGRWK